MRTTVNIDDALLSAVRQRAARENCSVGTVINDALRAEMAVQKDKSAAERKTRLVTFHGDGVRSGVHLDSMAELLDIMDGIS